MPKLRKCARRISSSFERTFLLTSCNHPRHHEAERANLVQKLQTVTSQRDILKNQYTKQRQVADELKVRVVLFHVMKPNVKVIDLVATIQTSNYGGSKS